MMLQKMLRRLLVLGLILTPFSANALIIQTNSFLPAADVTLEFDELGLATNTVVTDQYAGFGVTFAPNLVQSPQNMSQFSSNGDANNLGNFPNVVDPFWMQFGSDMSAVAFAYVTNAGDSTFTTFLNGVVQETATFATGFGGDDIYQFTGLFDEIRIDVGGSNSSMLLDNLQMTAVAEPGSMALLGAGFLTFGLLARRRRKT